MAKFFFVFLIIAFGLYLVTARPISAPTPSPTLGSSLMSRLKLDAKNTSCWDSLTKLEACTGEIVKFLIFGWLKIGPGCCKAILSISGQCWPQMLDTLGLTTEESVTLEDYCNPDKKASSKPSKPSLSRQSLTTTSSFSLISRLKLDSVSTNCQDSLVKLEACTGKFVQFFMWGKIELDHKCCESIHSISAQCWPKILAALGFTTEEGDKLEGYCGHVATDGVPSKPSLSQPSVTKNPAEVDFGMNIPVP